MRSFQAFAAIAAFGVIAAAAAPAAAKPVSLFAKVGADGAATDAAIKDCGEAAKGVRARTNLPVATSLNPYALAGTAIAAGFIQGYQQAKARRLSVEACMREEGFANLELTPAEDAEVRALKADARPAWRDAFLKADLKTRIAAALTPAVPPLAPAADEPLTHGGVRFDPAKLAAAPNAVGLNAPLLTGPVTHRRTATLAEPLTLPMVLNPHAEAGAVFHQVVADGATLWCGALDTKPLLTGEKHDTYCLASGFDGYHVGFGGPAWLGENAQWPQPMIARGGHLALKESDADLIGPMQLAIQATGFTRTGVMLEAVAQRDGGKAVFWRGPVVLDETGHGVLPFWTHRLQLQKTGKTLTATFTADGDGRGWDTQAAGPADRQTASAGSQAR